MVAPTTSNVIIAAPPAEPSRILGPFKLKEPLGKGGMGYVWRAEHVDLPLEAAIKVLDPSRVGADLGLDRFRQEIRAVGALAHPGIVGILDQGTLPPEVAEALGGLVPAGAPWLAMELIVGKSLAKRCGEVTWDELYHLTHQLLDALAHAHARGVVHCDLKPGNVLVDEAGNVKLVDFGLAQLDAHQDPEEGPGFGTPAYTPPEQLRRGVDPLGPWSDLYGLGCLLWALACGRPPHKRGTPKATLRAHLDAKLALWRPVHPMPPGVQPWLRVLLARDPEDRYHSAAQARAALEVAMQHPDWAVEETEDGTSNLLSVVPEVPEDWATLQPPPPPTPVKESGPEIFGLRRVPLIGRAGHRDLLWRSLMTASADKSVICRTLRGQPGVGKSRLADWLRELVEVSGGALTVTVRHSPQSGLGEGLAAAIRVALGVDSLPKEAGLRRMRTLLMRTGSREPWLQRTLEALLFREGELTAREAENTAAAVGELLLRLAGEHRPLVLWIDDAQWAEEAIDLVEWLTERDGDEAVLILATVNDAALDPDSPADQLLRRLSARGADIPVGPLPAPETARLVDELVQLEGGPRERLVTLSGGNPLFVTQLVGDWIRRGVLELHPDGFRPRDGAMEDIPEGLHALWDLRLDAALRDMGPRARIAVEAAAALGSVVDPDPWRRACAALGIPPEGFLLELVERLASAGLLEVGPSGWSWIHGLLRESVLGSARDGGRWTRGHAACASALAGSTRLEDRRRRVVHCLHAGDRASAIDELLIIGPALQSLGRIRTSLQAWQMAAELLEQTGASRDDPRRLIVVRGLAADLTVHRGAAAALPHAQEAVRLAQILVDPRAEALARRQLAWNLRRVGQVEQALVEARRGIAVALELDDPDIDAEVRQASADALRARGLLEEALAQWEAIDAIGRRLDSAELLAQARTSQAQILLQRGHVMAAYALAEQAVPLWAEAGNPRARAMTLGLLARCKASRHEGEAALELLAQAEQLVRVQGLQIALADHLDAAGEVYRRLGRTAEAATHYRKSQRIHIELGSVRQVVPATHLVLLSVEAGAGAEAERQALQLLEQVRAQGWLGLEACLVAAMVCIRAENSDWAGARAAAQALADMNHVADADTGPILRRAVKHARGQGAGLRRLISGLLGA